MAIPTVIENMARIRRLLFDPLATAPTDPQIYEAMQNVLQLQHNELANTTARWSCADLPLNFSSNNCVRTIEAEYFGKPFWAYEVDELGQFLRELPLYDLASARNDFSWQLLQPDAVACYRANNVWMARYTGAIVSDPLRIRLHYEDTQGEASDPADKRGLSPFQPLLRIQAALGALPGTEWEGARLGSKEHEAKVAMVRAQRQAEEAQHLVSFMRYKNTINRAGVNFRQPNYNREFYDYPRYFRRGRY